MILEDAGPCAACGGECSIMCYRKILVEDSEPRDFCSKQCYEAFALMHGYKPSDGNPLKKKKP